MSMTETAPTLPRETTALANAIAKLPIEQRAELVPLMQAVIDASGRRHRLLSLVQDALGQLRLDFKSLTFDLEATRRERDEYRRKAEGA